MSRCLNALCDKELPEQLELFPEDDAAFQEKWCSESCYNEWNRQSVIFSAAGDPFARRVHTYSEHRRENE